VTADEVLKAIEARRDPALKHHTNDDVVKVQWSEILVLEQAIDELRAENKALSSPCPTCGSSLFDCADCAMGLVRILRAERDELKEALEALRARGDT